MFSLYIQRGKNNRIIRRYIKIRIISNDNQEKNPEAKSAATSSALVRDISMRDGSTI